METTLGVIDSFSGEYRWLSNFAPVAVVLDGRTYPTVEHAYQAAKTFEFQDRAKIAKLKTPESAKKYGKSLKLRVDWESVKVGVMRDLLKQKFQDPYYQKLLLDTYPKKLVEGNWWRDTFWGVFEGKGENWLGKLLMEIRASLIAQMEINHAN